MLQKQNLALGASVANAINIGEEEIINKKVFVLMMNLSNIRFLMQLEIFICWVTTLSVSMLDISQVMH